MTKIAMTAAELQAVIFERILVRVTILPHISRGWTAKIYTSGPHTSADQLELDRLLLELQAKYELKSESTSVSQ
jgi:hypothetical protein